MRRRPLSLFCLAVILFLFLGTKLTAPAPSGFESREGEWVELTGSGPQKQVLYLHPVPKDGCLQQAEGVICYLKSNQALPEMGSIVRVRGKLKCFEPPSNPGQFDSKSYYHTLKISFQLNQTEIQAKSNTYHSGSGDGAVRLSDRLFDIGPAGNPDVCHSYGGSAL